MNAVAPTFIETALTNKLLGDPAISNGILSRTPLGRVVRVEEVAAAVLFLSSTDASAITGIVMPVDGGWTAI